MAIPIRLSRSHYEDIRQLKHYYYKYKWNLGAASIPIYSKLQLARNI